MTWRSHKPCILGWIFPCSLGWCSPLGQPLHAPCATQWGKKYWSRTSHPAAFQLENLMKLTCFHSGLRQNDASNLKKITEMSLRQPWPKKQLTPSPLSDSMRHQDQLLIAHPQTSMLGLKRQLGHQSPWFWSGTTLPRMRKGPAESLFSWFFILALCVISLKQKCCF